MDNNSLKSFYQKEISSFETSYLKSNYLEVILLILFIFSIIIILYTRLFFATEFENWEIQKCNPKYIFYSGYIKQNPNSNSFYSTIDNFHECIVKFNSKKDNHFSKVLEESKLEHLQQTENAINTHNKLSREKVLELQKKVNAKNEEFKIQIDNVKESRGMSALQNEIDKLNAIISDIKEYAHTYLTYAMMNFVFKYKISEEDGTSGNELNESEACENNFTNESDCNSNVYCNYDNSNNKCSNITKGEFYSQEALKINKIIRNYFGNNKL